MSIRDKTYAEILNEMNSLLDGRKERKMLPNDPFFTQRDVSQPTFARDDPAGSWSQPSREKNKKGKGLFFFSFRNIKVTYL